MTLTTSTNVSSILPNALHLMQQNAHAANPLNHLELYDLNFRLDGVAFCVQQAHDETQSFISDILHRRHDRARWLTLYGLSGSGKTHLAQAAQRVLKQNKRRARFRRWGDALNNMLSGDWELMRYLADETPILMLDDIGAEYTGSDKMRALGAAKMLELLESRLNKWTIITTNLRPKQIGEQIDPRIASRLYRGQNVLVDMSREAGATDFGVRMYKERRVYK